jgi:hypothetical protein
MDEVAVTEKLDVKKEVIQILKEELAPALAGIGGKLCDRVLVPYAHQKIKETATQIDDGLEPIVVPQAVNLFKKALADLLAKIK